MKNLLVAIVGRPNTGKSSLFNVLVGSRASIVTDEAGTTRDRVYGTTEWAGRNLTVVDTGGVDFDEGNVYAAHIREQVDIAIDLADVIVFLTDGEAGVTPEDTDIANILRRSKKPVVLAVNKLDNTKREQDTLFEFYRLNVGDPVAVSCTQKRGIGDLLDAVTTPSKTHITHQNHPTACGGPPLQGGELTTCSYQEPALGKGKKLSPLLGGVPEQREGGVVYEANEPTRIAIVGKPNAGKSSIVNRLLGEKRVMVSDVAGTTRDSIDTPFRYQGRDFILTDTAGIRRKRSIETQTIEHYSVLRALAAIRNSDVCVLVVDAVEGLTEQDVRLAGYIHDEGKPSVVVVNKWDIAGQITNHKLQITNEGEKSRLFLEYQKMLERDLAFMPYFKAVFISALTGQRVGEVMKAVESVLAASKTRITTGKLNQLFMDFAAVNPTRAKIKYVTQVAVSPPTFAVFVSKKELLPPTYMRYLENNLRKSIDFTGTPVRLLLRSNNEANDK